MTPQLDTLAELLAKATPTEDAPQHEPTDRVFQRYSVRGVPCGFPVAIFGEIQDAQLFITMKAFLRDNLPAIREQADEVERLREVLHAIDQEAMHTIPPDGKFAAYAALGRISKLINPFRLPALDPQQKNNNGLL